MCSNAICIIAGTQGATEIVGAVVSGGAPQRVVFDQDRVTGGGVGALACRSSPCCVAQLKPSGFRFRSNTIPHPHLTPGHWRAGPHPEHSRLSGLFSLPMASTKIGPKPLRNVMFPFVHTGILVPWRFGSPDLNRPPIKTGKVRRLWAGVGSNAYSPPCGRWAVTDMKRSSLWPRCSPCGRRGRFFPQPRSRVGIAPSGATAVTVMTVFFRYFALAGGHRISEHFTSNLQTFHIPSDAFNVRVKGDASDSDLKFVRLGSVRMQYAANSLARSLCAGPFRRFVTLEITPQQGEPIREIQP